jgi:NADPH:quinone reductase-like Zn-dependent oxidoreductase
MKAVRNPISKGSPDQLVYEDAPQPEPKAGEVLVRVYAVGVSPAEFTWSNNWTLKNGEPRPLPVIWGHELSGVVAQVGAGVSGVNVGDAVYALTDFWRDGAQAEYVITLPSELAPKPRSLDHVQAASVPLSGLTAWQALFDHAQLSAGQRVLIHGASGGVGSFAVQFAHWKGAYVIAVASAASADFVRGLGADEVIDYQQVRFETVVRDVDVVLDTQGGDTLERSWGVLKRGGVMVGIANDGPTQERAAQEGVRAVWFIVEPSREALIEIGKLIDAGTIQPIVERVLPLAQAREAYTHPAGTSTRGKTVLQVVE